MLFCHNYCRMPMQQCLRLLHKVYKLVNLNPKSIVKIAVQFCECIRLKKSESRINKLHGASFTLLSLQSLLTIVTFDLVCLGNHLDP